MTSLVLLLVFNAGMLLGIVLHDLFSVGPREDATVLLEVAPAFREDLLMPIMSAKDRYLH